MHWPVFLLFLLFAGSASAQLVFRDGFEARALKSGLGTNLEAVEDFAAAYPFVDFFKQSRPWFTANQTTFDTDEAAQLDLDADGWVRSLPPCDPAPPQFCFARTVLNSGGADYPNGEYTVLYDGQGTLTYSGAASVIARMPGRDRIAIDADDIVVITLTETAPAPNHLRNIRVLAPGFVPEQPVPIPTFHPDFLARLMPYRAIRFMDWMRANGGGFGGAENPQVSFTQRPRVTDAQWTREGGVPLEVMIDLANAAAAEPWFTLPHGVDDDYVRQFAALVKTRLTPGRRVYVEHSNEVWNSFPQGFAVEDAALAQFPGGSDSAFTKRMNLHGLRTAQICRMFREVYAQAPARDTREIVCTLGAQAANAFTATEAADCPLAVAAGLAQQRCLGPDDAVAIAPYFGNYLDVPLNANEVQTWTLDKLFAEINQGGQLADSFDDASTPCSENFPQNRTLPCPMSALAEVQLWMQSQRSAAISRGMRLIAYEGGQHLVGVQGVENNTAVTALFVAANRDARMGAAYAAYLASWKASGGELFVHFTLTSGYGRFGSWGALEGLKQSPEPPKQQALVQFNAANPCWWAGCND